MCLLLLFSFSSTDFALLGVGAVLLLLAFVSTNILLMMYCAKKGRWHLYSAELLLHVHIIGGGGHPIIAESAFCCGVYLGQGSPLILAYLLNFY
jgi:hypothetical protein